MMKKSDIFFALTTLLFAGAALTLHFSTITPAPPYQIFTQRAEADALQPEVRKIDVNTADKETLMKLPGIGEVLAERILADRAENGPYTGPEDLLRVKGIGASQLEKMEEDLWWKDEVNDENSGS